MTSDRHTTETAPDMPVSPGAILPRRLKPVISRRLEEEPVIMLTGPRTAGKSMILDAVAESRGVTVTDLDDLETRRAVADDPGLFISQGREPVCLDEFQHVPTVLDAIKAELNRDLRPGRFLLTGSTRYATLPAASQSLAGRVHLMTLWPLSQGEVRLREETFLDRLVTEPAGLAAAGPSMTTRQDYEAMMLAGGFPLALTRPTARSRDRWFGDYITTVMERDVLEIRKVRQREVLPRILRHLAARTAGVLNLSDVASRVELDKSTTGDFVRLLESVFLVHRLPGYGRTLSSRATAAPKVHLIDSGLAAYLMGLDQERLAARNPTALSEFGHLVETFAVNEILKQASWSEFDLRFSHYRSKDGPEVDLVAETRGGRTVGVEVKAAGQVNDSDLRGFRDLRNRLGEDFVAGVVLHLGRHSRTLDDRLFAIPLDRLWT